tara:strand:- start:129 stop:629 length:501 start_codon:yes stop_codon:yes gene_type:complete
MAKRPKVTKYKVKNPKKYIGNETTAFARSSWELRLMREFDRNPKVTKWVSESVIVPYFHPIKNRPARYFPDFIVEWENSEIIMIEVKPYKETQLPKKDGRKIRRTTIREQITYGTNITKWEAANTYCEKKGWKFWIIHENNVESYFPGVKFLKPFKKPHKKRINRK